MEGKGGKKEQNRSQNAKLINLLNKNTLKHFVWIDLSI